MAFSNTLTLSSRTVNETRVQFAYGDLKALPSDPIGPAVSIAGVASFGTLSGSPQGRLNKMYQVVNNLSHQAGAHAVRAGVDFIYNDDTITFPATVRGTYAFSSLANFLDGTYNASGFTQTFGDTVVSQRNPNLGLYVQDEWKATSSLTVNAGLRYDLQFLETIKHGHKQRVAAARLCVVAGRFEADRRSRQRGVVLRSRSAARVAQRAPVGRKHGGSDRASADWHQPLADSGGSAGVSEHPGRRGALGDALESDDDGSGHSERAIRGRPASRWSGRSGDYGTFSVGYQYVRGLNLIIQVNQNVPTCAAAGTNNGCRPNPNYANNNQYSSEAESNYHGLHLSFVQRPGIVGPLQSVVHALEVDEQRRRELLQLADRSHRPLEGLGPFG